MTPERWKQIEELYRAAVECAPEERSAAFARADPEVRVTVEKMVEQGSAVNILDTPAWEGEDDSLSPPLGPGARLGPYAIEELIGEGGMGAVYRAYDSRLSRDVAIKTLPSSLAGDPDRLRRFEQEARAIGALNHPNILTVYDVGVEQGAPYLVSELLVGKTLRDLLRSGKIARSKAIDYAREIAGGLAAAHERGITHRDLKPENLFLTKDGRLKILDFGLAKFRGTSHNLGALSTEMGIGEQSAASHPGIIVGTVGYMSPEQIQTGDVDQRSDLFNLGLILYEMLTGKRAFEGASTIETLHAILKDEPDLTDVDPDLGSGLTRCLRHCLEKDPRERFQSAKDLAFALGALAVPSQERTRRPSSGVRFTVAAIALLLLPLLLLSGRRLWLLESQPRPTFRQITFRSGNIAGGRFTPDGQTVVYGAAWEGAPIELFTTRVDGPESRPLGVPQAGVAAISPTAELALMLGCELNWGECRGTLARMPLAGGAPREVAQEVDYADWDRHGELAVARFHEGRSALEYPLGNVLYESATGWISHPRFSPQGDRIAFLNHPSFGDNQGSVEVVDLEGRNVTLVSDRKGLKGLAWSPNGEEVWFSGSDANSRSPALRAVNLSGEERLVLQSPGWTEIMDIASDGRVLLLRQNPRTNMIYASADLSSRRSLSWFDWSTTADLSSDGSILLFYDWGEAAGSEPIAYLRNTERGEAIRLGEGKAMALSPDRNWALTLKAGPPAQLILLPTGAGEPKALPRSGIDIYYAATWFPDGKRLLLTGEGSDHTPRSIIQQVDSGAAVDIGFEGLRAALISPDGERLAAYGPDGDYYLLSPIDGELVPLPGAEFGDELLQWSADGGSIFVRGLNDSEIEIFRIDVSTGRREHWSTLEPPDPVGFIGIENASGATRITPDGRTSVYTYWQARGELYIADGLR